LKIHSAEAGRALKRLATATERAARKAFAEAVKETVKHARGTKLFKNRTGATRATIGSAIAGDHGIVSAEGAAHWLENGTRPHEIAPKAGGLLVFQVNGSTVFTRKPVNHPGTAERPFMQQARDHGAKVLEFGADVYVGEAIRGAE